MKLKTFNQANSTFKKAESAPAVTISKSGVVSLNKSLCEALKLKEGSCVNIHQDEDSPEDWYIEPSKEEKAMKLRGYKNQNGLCFNSSVITTEILKSVKETATCRFKVATKPLEEFANLYAIITSSKVVNKK